MIESNNLLHDLFELRIFHDETHEVVQQVREQVPLGVLKLGRILFKVHRTPPPFRGFPLILGLKILNRSLNNFLPLWV